MFEKYDEWVSEFMESWKNLDWKRTLKTLSKDVEYYENPIDEPCKNFEEVVNLWNVVADNQKDINYKYEIIAYNENVCIVNWQMTRVLTNGNIEQNIDGIFEVALNEEGKCILFKQWRYTK